MTVAEYDHERAYLIIHWEDMTQGNYKPLWKQKLDKDSDYEEHLAEAQAHVSEHSQTLYLIDHLVKSTL